MQSGNTTLRQGTPLIHLKQLIPFLFFLLFSQFSIAQTEQDITPLLQSRNERIASNLSTRDIDMQLYTMGHRPKAVISSQLLENGQLRIEFPTYQPIPEAKKSRIEERLGQHYGSYLLSINVDPVQQQVVILVLASVTPEQLDAIFDHFGYLGHE